MKRPRKILITAADLPQTTLIPTWLDAQWFRPKITRSFEEDRINTFGDLIDLISRRGPGWWRSIPRVDAGRAGTIMRWLHQWPDQLGKIDLGPVHVARVDNFDLLPVLDTTKRREVAPLGTFQLPAWLSGTDGANRAPAFCFISAGNDLEAINAYLNRYKGQGHTERAYRKELERFILWCALVAYKPMSSLLVDDCELYKHILRAPLPEFRGERTVKTSKRWRPFALKTMDAESQKYAVRVLRAMFDWLVKVRYLAGNPWIAVKDPVVTKQADAMRIDRALSTNAWDTVVNVLSERGVMAENSQDRVALAAILLMGDSGLRRAEVANSRRHNLKASRHALGVWMLTVLGKRSTMRRVPVSPRTIDALRAHWRDRGLDFDSQTDDLPLLAPVVVPGTETARARHEAGSTNGYYSNSLYSVVAAALRRIQKHVANVTSGEAPLLTPEDLAQLEDASPHSFRHTFGTQAVDSGMPLQVAQNILGHASSSTTAIYVKAKERRIAEAAEDYYNRNGIVAGREK